MRFSLPTIFVCLGVLVGCGSTKWTDTQRTATEQLLISDAMDRAVARLDFRAVAGKSVYLDSTPITGLTDSPYLNSLLRQHLLASGCILKEAREEADYVVEVRAGVIGTDRYDVLFGMPATSVSGMLPLEGVPSTIPELPLAKKTEQRAVAKIALFAYNRKTGRPVWQSGVVPVESTAKNIWVLGAGPFERGSIFDGTKFVGDRIKIPLISPRKKKGKRELVSVTEQAFFSEPQEKEKKLVNEQQLADGNGQAKPKPAEPAAAKTEVAEQEKPSAAAGQVIPAGHTAPAAAPQAEPPKQPPAETPPPEPPQQPPSGVPEPEIPQPQAESPPPRLLPMDLDFSVPSILSQPETIAPALLDLPLETPDSPYPLQLHTQPFAVPPFDDPAYLP